MTKKKRTAIVALITGGIILTGAAFANFAASNGYNAYKEGVRKVLEQGNYTISTEASLSLDGKEIAGYYGKEEYDGKSGALNNMMKTTMYGAVTMEEETYHLSDGTEIRYSSLPNFGSYGEDIPENSYFVQDLYKEDIYPTINKSDMFGMYGEDEEMFDKYYRFTSGIADMIVGDLKNSFYLAKAENGNVTYQLKLDLFQIPEFVNAGVDLIFSSMSSEMGNYNEEELSPDEQAFLNIAKNPFVSGAECSVTIDENGLITDNLLTADLTGNDKDGNPHTLTFSLHIEGSDYGTTAPGKPDMKGKNVVYLSERVRTRIAELEVLLNSAEDDEARERYQREYEGKKKVIDMFDSGKLLDEDEFYSDYTYEEPDETGYEAIDETDDGSYEEESI